ncbi:MAG: DNA-formamidopyrimidine glycosylase family protein [Actinomycetota bacterium]|nr:Fpg/Nei family DNA glycosylase [Actinomycetota bacterium]
MPEGDTVFLAADRLDRALRGRVLTRTDFRVPRYSTLDLAGRRIHEVVARGKHLLFRIAGNMTLHTHFQMDGTWHIYRPGERWRVPAHEARVVLETDVFTVVGFRLPVIDVLDRAAEQSVVGHLGPDLLGPDWDPVEAERRLAADPARPIGEALLDQAVMAGLGNVYRSEICFLMGLDPMTPVGEVPEPARVVGRARAVIYANRTTGNQITTGDARPGRTHWVYGRGGEPCRRCGDPIERTHSGPNGRERVIYRCPRCQPAGRKAHSVTQVRGLADA